MVIIRVVVGIEEEVEVEIIEVELFIPEEEVVTIVVVGGGGGGVEVVVEVLGPSVVLVVLVVLHFGSVAHGQVPNKQLSTPPHVPSAIGSQQENVVPVCEQNVLRGQQRGVAVESVPHGAVMFLLHSRAVGGVREETFRIEVTRRKDVERLRMENCIVARIRNINN